MLAWWTAWGFMLSPLSADEALSIESRARALPFNRSVYELRVPDWIDCLGPGFSPMWEAFHELAMVWDRFVVSTAYKREGAAAVLLDQQLADVGEKLAEMSHDLLEFHFPHIRATDGTGLDQVVRGLMRPEELQGTCYYGFVYCLWIRAQMLMLHQTDIRVGEAILELQTAMSILGPDFRADHLDSSRWPIRGIDISESIEEEGIVRVSDLSISSVPEGAVKPRQAHHGGLFLLPRHWKSGLG